ncbi:MAG: hypothetical protein MI757_14850 [Pirellulales bacterium]|nr:hypothetical protein [Pirellulales bacterium]
MWCSSCRQDVPAIAIADDSTRHPQYCCARCNQLFDSQPDNVDSGDLDGAHVSSTTQRVSLEPPVDVDAWALESLPSDHLLATATLARPAKRTKQDPVHDMASNWHLGGMLASATANATPNVETEVRQQKRKPRTSLTGWVLMLCGIMAFACGAVLMGLSLAQSRGELWRMGLPMALAGQCGLVVGLVLQIERFWQNHKRANEKLEKVDENVSDLQMTTDLLGSTHSGPSQAFYQHMAGGANTGLLLADLKGQMDLLAAQMARSGR